MRRVILCYRKLIDGQSARPWDKLVYEDSYRELRMQAQYFNPEGRHRTFGELLHYVPAAERLHGLVSGAVLGYLRQLGGLVPDLADNLGRRFLKFENFRFEIVNSDFQDQSQHRVAVNFFTDPLYWHESIAPFLLLSPAPPDATTGEQLTHLLQLQPFLSIHALLPATGSGGKFRTMSASSPPGQIYLADQRGLTQTAQQQRYSTFNFGAYTAESREPFGRLLAVNEESLAPGQQVEFLIDQPIYLVLLPVTGAVAYVGPAGLHGSTDVEQVQVLNLPAGSSVALRNPYDDAIITFLHLWLRTDAPVGEASTAQFPYQFAALDNQLAELVPLTGEQPFSLHLGRLQGRHEVVYRTTQPGGRLFAFVLAGAFELEGRLLHAKDSLALWDCPAAELEALSNDALVLVVEL